MGSIRNLSAGDPALHSHTIGKEATCDAAADIPIVGFDAIFGDFGLSDTRPWSTEYPFDISFDIEHGHIFSSASWSSRFIHFD